MHIYIYIHVCVYTYVHICINVYIHKDRDVNADTDINIDIHAQIQRYIMSYVYNTSFTTINEDFGEYRIQRSYGTCVVSGCHLCK